MDPILLIILFFFVLLLFPAGFVYYILLKKKSKKVLEKAYSLEKELDNHYKTFESTKTQALDSVTTVDHFKTKEEKKDFLYNKYELLDKLENTVFLISTKMDTMKEHVVFLSTMRFIKINDKILEKDLSHYKINSGDLFSQIEQKKKEIYNQFKVFE